MIDRILPYLYISDYESSECINLLFHYNILTICTISYRNHNKLFIEECNKSNIKLNQFKIEDDGDLVNIIPLCKKIYKIIEKSRIHNNIHYNYHSILVHCDAGISRSASVIIYYLMKSYKWNYNESYIYLKNIRNIISPNEGFRDQLKLLEKKQNKIKIINTSNDNKNDSNNSESQTESNEYNKEKEKPFNLAEKFKQDLFITQHSINNNSHNNNNNNNILDSKEFVYNVKVNSNGNIGNNYHISSPFLDSAEEVLAILAMKKVRAIHYNMENDNIPAQILPRLYLGSIGAAKNLQFIKKYKITHIVCVGKNIPLFHVNNHSCCDIQYKQINVLDGETSDIQQYFNDTIEFIDSVLFDPHSSDNSVLIHCFAGRSRSTTIVLAYLLHCYYNNFNQSIFISVKEFIQTTTMLRCDNNNNNEILMILLKFIQVTRKEAQPNDGFIKQLKHFENQLKNNINNQKTIEKDNIIYNTNTSNKTTGE